MTDADSSLKYSTGLSLPRLAATPAALLAIALVIAPAARAQAYTLLYSFQCAPNDGGYPSSALTLDAQGNLYGATDGGAYGYGTIFELAPDGVETILHNFLGPPSDGNAPDFGPLIRDAAGNLYGTTVDGGRANSGTVFKLAASGQISILQNFGGASSSPLAGLTPDSSGNFYGTLADTFPELGEIYEITRSGQAKLLYEFEAQQVGRSPIGGLVRDSAGNLYGTTYEGGLHMDGTVYELSPGGSLTVLYNFFGGLDGKNPYDRLVRDSAGSLYGTTFAGGVGGAGTVFKVSPAGKARLLHDFTGQPDGANPIAGLLRDPSGNLFGVTSYGGTGACNDGFGLGCGTIFEVTAEGKYNVLYSFGGTPDGFGPVGGLVRDSSGSLYGTTNEGGAYGCGTVWKFAP